MKTKSILGATIASLLAFGAAAQAQDLSPTGDLDRDGIQNRHDGDRDGDGIANRSDPNPNVFNRTYVAPHAGDMDRDGIADRSDRDRDGDGIANARDANPNDPRCLLYTSPSPRDGLLSRMPSSA